MSRIDLTQATTFYVNSVTGSDTTGDGSISNPLATIQQAHDLIQNCYDIKSQQVTIDITGNFSHGLTQIGPLVGQRGPLILNFQDGAVIYTADDHVFLSIYSLGFIIQSSGSSGLAFTTLILLESKDLSF